MKKFASVLALSLVLAACGAETSATYSEIGSGLDGDGQFAAQAPTTTAGASEGVPDEDGQVAVNLDVAGDRKVIRQARLELQADDTRAAFDHIVQLAEAAGGFISNATVSPVEGEDDLPEVVMTLRVPADHLTETMASIKGVADEVISESQGAQDVTDQFIDLEARLTNLGALEVELRALLAEVRQQPDADPDELLRVFTEISNVRGEIEQIQGQLNYLDDVVTMATLDVSLTPTPAVVPIVEDTWRPVEVARDALRNLVSGLQGVADWAIHFALFTLPMLLLTLGLPLAVVFIVYHQWRKRRPPATPAPTVPAES
ncbi:MAG: DUF4349 domain-containing protein [Acidimicrobiia bacterium]